MRSTASAGSSSARGDELWLGTAANTIGDVLDYLASIGEDDLLGSQT